MVGLGNPGSAYANTRHNVGYRVVGRLARRSSIDLKHSGIASVGVGEIEGRETILARPRTFMNKSGDALRALVDRFHLPVTSLVLIYDDLDLPVGQVRLRARGGSGGMKGIGSVIQKLGSSDFGRIRIGIGRPYHDGEPVYTPAEIADWVLSQPPLDEAKKLDEAVDEAVAALLTILRDGFEMAMNQHNRRQPD